MKVIKKILKGIVILLILANVALFVTGHTYIYKGLVNTYLVGQSGPGISEHDIFSNRTIKADLPQPWPIGSAYGNLELSTSAISEIEQYKTVSFLVFKQDSLVFEKYWEGYNDHSITNSFSVAKSITATLIGVAIMEGYIQSLDQPVGDFLESFTIEGKEKITIRHLITMSSGLDWTESGGNPFSDNAEAYYGWDLHGQIERLNSIAEPGKEFVYLSGNHQVLGFVVEAATGMTLSDYASEKLWKPMGAESDALWNLDKENGVEKAYCCFYATARDFARIGKLYLQNGNWNGQQLLPEWFAIEATSPNGLAETDGTKCQRYGLSWWVNTYSGYHIYYARGILGQYIIVIPELELIITRAGHERGTVGQDGHPGDFYVYVDAALEMLE